MTFDRTVFVTTVTWQRTLLFRNPQKAELMMDVLAHHGEQKKYVMHEFVIMPDHLHLLLTPAADISLERAMQLIKGGGVSTRQDWAREREARIGLAGKLHQPSDSRRAGLRSTWRLHSHESGSRTPSGRATVVPVFVGRPRKCRPLMMEERPFMAA